MIKVLQLVGGGMAIGGVEKMLLNYYAYMDRSKVRFDFCFYRRSTLVASHTEFAGLLKDASVYDLRLFEGSGKFFGYIKAIPRVWSLIKKGGYDVVHINAGRPPLLLSGLLAAWLAGAKVRLTHSHSTKGKSGRSWLADLAYSIGFAFVRPILRGLSTHLGACSTEAAKYMFGENVVNSPKYMPIHNAIIVKPYTYSEEIRAEVRKELGAEGNMLVFGHLGRFSTPKNHFFLIEVFAAIRRRNSNCVLWLAGDGEMREAVEQKIKDCKVEDSVVLLGERNDSDRLYQGMDALLFPSLWEGLSVVLVEAQSAALPVFASASISPEHRISDRLRFIELEKGADFWADYVLRELNTFPKRKDISNQITEAGYNIENEAVKLQDFYTKSVKEL